MFWKVIALTAIVIVVLIGATVADKLDESSCSNRNAAQAVDSGRLYGGYGYGNPYISRYRPGCDGFLPW